MAVLPGSVDKHFDAIAMWENGMLILGTSSLTGKYWGGSVWCYNDPTIIPAVDKCVTGVETEAGVSDLVSLGQGKVMLALDSGAVEIMQLETDPVHLNSVFYACEHDNLVSCINTFSDKSKVVSSSHDLSIKVWDLEAMLSCLTIRPAHGNVIHQVVTCKSIPHLFLSCSRDQRLRLWDVRDPNKPCIVSTIQGSKIMPTAVAIQPNSTIYAVGNEIGEIQIGDFRKTESDDLQFPHLVPTLGKIKAHERRVRKLEFSNEKPELLASCADANDICVTTLSGDNVPTNSSWRNSSHKSFVRDLLWDADDKLLSCGWDSAVHVNQVSPDPVMDTQ